MELAKKYLYVKMDFILKSLPKGYHVSLNVHRGTLNTKMLQHNIVFNVVKIARPV